MTNNLQQIQAILASGHRFRANRDNELITFLYKNQLGIFVFDSQTRTIKEKTVIMSYNSVLLGAQDLEKLTNIEIIPIEPVEYKMEEKVKILATDEIAEIIEVPMNPAMPYTLKRNVYSSLFPTLYFAWWQLCKVPKEENN